MQVIRTDFTPAADESPSPARRRVMLCELIADARSYPPPDPTHEPMVRLLEACRDADQIDAGLAFGSAYALCSAGLAPVVLAAMFDVTDLYEEEIIAAVGK